MSDQDPQPLDELVRWFVQTVHSCPHGEVGIHAIMQDGKLVQTRRILNATARPGSGAVPSQKWTPVDSTGQYGVGFGSTSRKR